MSLDLEDSLRRVESTDEETRQAALLELVFSGDIRTIPALERVATRDPNLKLRYLARKALYLLNKAGEEAASPGEPAVAPPEGPSAASGALSPEIIVGILDGNDGPRKVKLLKGAVQHRIVTIVRPILDRLGGEPDPEVRATMVLAVGILGTKAEVAPVSRALQDPDAGVRASAIEALQYIGHPSVYGHIVPFVGDSDLRIRSNAIKALRAYGKVNVHKLFSQMLNSRQTDLRESAANALIIINSRDFLPLIKKAIDDPEPSVKERGRQALERLVQRGHPDAVQLASALSGSGEPIPASAELDGSGTAIQSISLLSDPDANVRRAEIDRIVRDKDTKSLPGIVRRLFHEPDEKLRATIVVALGKIGNASLQAVLAGALEDPVPRVRANAIEALTTIKAPDLVPLVSPMLEDDNNRVRANAIVALKGAPDVNIVGPLSEMVHSPESLYRRSAFYAIADIGDPRVLPFLQTLVVDPDESLRDKALDYLAQVKDQKTEIGRAIEHWIREIRPDVVARPAADGLQSLQQEAVPVAAPQPPADTGPVAAGPASRATGGFSAFGPERDGAHSSGFGVDGAAAGEGSATGARPAAIPAASAEGPADAGAASDDGSHSPESSAQASPLLARRASRNPDQSSIDSSSSGWTRMSAVLTKKDQEEVVFTEDHRKMFRYESFRHASAERKKTILEESRRFINAHVYYFLKEVEQKESLEIRLLSKLALKNFQGQDFGGILESGEEDLTRRIDACREPQQVESRTHKTIMQLGQDLASRFRVAQTAGIWKGPFDQKLQILNALREDTQDMITEIVGQETLQRVSLCYYHPKMKLFLQSERSLDSNLYEQIVTLLPVMNRLDQFNMMVPFLRSVKLPCYMLVLLTDRRVILFLRAWLGGKSSKYLAIPLQLITRIEQSSMRGLATIHLQVGPDFMEIPELEQGEAEKLTEILRRESVEKIQSEERFIDIDFQEELKKLELLKSAKAISETEYVHRRERVLKMDREKFSQRNIEKILTRRYKDEELAARVDQQLLERFRTELTVVFTDMYGYSRKMSEKYILDALTILAIHDSLLMPQIKKRAGNLIKKMGDAFMVSFKEPVDAVHAALDMQKALAEFNTKNEDEILIRIGINTGYVFIKDGDIFGEAVNVAARMEPLAQPGRIVVTQRTYELVKLMFKCEDLGERTIKGGREPIRTYCVVS